MLWSRYTRVAAICLSLAVAAGGVVVTAKSRSKAVWETLPETPSRRLQADGGLVPARPRIVAGRPPIERGETPTVQRSDQAVDRRSGSGSPAEKPTLPEGTLDLNQASVLQLEELPGIGPRLAQLVVEHRSRKGAYKTVDDLLDVKGIGPAKIERLRSLVCVGGGGQGTRGE